MRSERGEGSVKQLIGEIKNRSTDRVMELKVRSIGWVKEAVVRSNKWVIEVEGGPRQNDFGNRN